MMSLGGIAANERRRDTIFFGIYGKSDWAMSSTSLDSTWTEPICRVRRDSDNAESDFYIGATVGSLNTTLGGGGTSLASWVGAGNGYAVKVWDPTGGGNHCVQTNTSYQPKIVSSGTMLTENGLPTYDFDGTNDFFNLTSTISGTSSWHVMMVARRRSSGTVGPVFGGDSSQYAAWVYSDNNWYARGREGYISSGTSGTHASFALLTTEWISGGTKTVYLNGTSLFSGTPSLPVSDDFKYVGKRGSDYTNGTISEVILWKADKSSTRSAMDSTRKTFFGL